MNAGVADAGLWMSMTSAWTSAGVIIAGHHCSAARVEADPEFKYINDDLERIKKRTAENRISLNEKVRRTEIDEERAIPVAPPKLSALRGPATFPSGRRSVMPFFRELFYDEPPAGSGSEYLSSPPVPRPNGPSSHADGFGSAGAPGSVPVHRCPGCGPQNW